MYRGKTVGVVVPAYNEEGFVGDVIAGIPAFVDRIYAVDDCSTDGTWAEILAQRAVPEQAPDRSAAEHVDDSVAKADGGVSTDRLVPIRHETNGGVGAAIKTGYRRAVDDGIDAVAVINGDGQMDPGILDRFVEPIVEGQADFTKGNRLHSPATWRGMSSFRLFGNVLLTFLTKIASGYWKMNDPQNGYTAIATRAFERLDLDDLYEGYGFCNDLLVKLNAHGFRITDVTMEAVYGDEESDIRYYSFVPRLSALLAKAFVWRLGTKYVARDFHPLILFYLLGFVGIGSGIASTSIALLGGAVSLGVSLLILFIFLFSSTLVVLAMTFDRQYNQRLERHSHGSVSDR